MEGFVRDATARLKFAPDGQGVTISVDALRKTPKPQGDLPVPSFFSAAYAPTLLNPQQQQQQIFQQLAPAAQPQILQHLSDPSRGLVLQGGAALPPLAAEWLKHPAYRLMLDAPAKASLGAFGPVAAAAAGEQRKTAAAAATTKKQTAAESKQTAATGGRKAGGGTPEPRRRVLRQQQQRPQRQPSEEEDTSEAAPFFSPPPRPLPRKKKKPAPRGDSPRRPPAAAVTVPLANRGNGGYFPRRPYALMKKADQREEDDKVSTRVTVRRKWLDNFESRNYYRYELPTISGLSAAELPELFLPPCLSTTPMYEVALN